MEMQEQEVQPINQPVKKSGISTLAGIIIIVAAAVILFGGVFAYQYFFVKPQPTTQIQNQTDQTSIQPSSEHNCFDSDGGLNYYVAGQASIPETIHSGGGMPEFIDDECVNASTLREAICTNNRLDSVNYVCPDGCRDGACLRISHETGWKIYTNSEYGFSFEYRADATYILADPLAQSIGCNSAHENDSCKFFTSSIDREFAGLYYNAGMSIEVVNRALDNESIHKLDSDSGVEKVDTTKPITIGGKTGFEYDLVSAVNYKIHGFMVPLDNDHFLEVSENSKAPFLGQSDWVRIISSFRFLTQAEKENTAPVINGVLPVSGSAGAVIEIKGSGFAGWEGDLNLWIENSAGVKGIIYGDKTKSSDSSIKFVLPASVCQKDNSYSGLPCSVSMQLTPGNYKIFVNPWGAESNKIDFVIK